MPTDPRVDAYIDRAEPFARPILAHLRALIHAAVPSVGETIKWGRPFFTIDGRPLAFVAAFKAHAALGFWRSGTTTGREAESSGQFGRITSLADLPDEASVRAIIAEAAATMTEPRVSKPARTPRPAPTVPDDLARVLAADRVAAATYARLSPSHAREYVEWIEGAKRPETRARRIAQTAERLGAGETLNARYEKC